MDEETDSSLFRKAPVGFAHHIHLLKKHQYHSINYFESFGLFQIR
jgi:hypothetical protein